MTSARRLRSYDYVNQPLAPVLDALKRGASGIFARATNGAAERERAIGVQLRVKLGPLDVATDVRVEVGPVEGPVASAAGHEVSVFPLTWSAASRPSLFPHMQAKLLVYALSSSETQLEFEGTYDPPFGLLGEAIDSVAGHRIAEACVLHFVQDVAAQIRTELGTPAKV
jgi:hypothetical protein